MPKHLYFNPKNFDELVLSGVLIELFKNDLEVHSHENGQTLRFVQGENIVENNIDNILRFANTISGHKIFGRNWQQQAVINMINGVCKDIEKKLSVTVESSQIRDKIEYLNTFWFNKSNEWIKKRFYSCHMELLTLSFAIQELFPEILTKYQCFVELRRLFIEQKLLSKASLIAMFTHPDNKYQEYDLFPELESSIHDVRRSMGSTYGEDNGEFIKDNNLDSYVQVTAHVMDDEELMKGETSTQMITEQLSQMITVNTNHDEKEHVQDQKHIHDHKPQHAHHEHQSQIPQPQPQEQKSNKVHPEQIVISQIRQQQSAIVTNMTSDISTIQQETHHFVSQQIIVVPKTQQKHDHSQGHHEHHEHHHEQNHPQQQQHHHEEQASEHKNDHHNDINNEQSSSIMKKSLKDQFSQHLTKPLQYVTKNSVHQQKPNHEELNKNVNQPQPLQPLSQQQQQAVPIHESHQQKQQNTSQPLKTAHPIVQLKKQALIQEAQSQNYVSQQNVHHEKEQTLIVEKEEKHSKKSHEEKIQSKNIQPLQQQNKAPESQSHNASVKGPKSAMDNNKRIKPKQQSVAVHKETCKCEIF